MNHNTFIMNKRIIIPAAIALTTFSVVAQTAAPVVTPPVAIPLKATPSAAQRSTPKDSELAKLTEKNALRAEQLKAELAETRAEISKLKLQRELLTEQQQIEDLKQATLEKAELKTATDLEEKLKREASIAKSKASLASSALALEKTELLRNTTLQTAELEAIKIDSERANFADNKPIYLENPLQDTTLIISDRRIAFNGAVTASTADHICDRIHYYNNKNKTLPIFIVIDYSPGGSVMAGYRILKAMEGSSAPIHVVVKSFAASMAATITTLAEESYAYPNAIILHHQLSSSFFFTTMNLTQQKESLANANKWWEKLATPVAKKMGISTDQFIKQMYDKNSDGDWVEFATDAQKLKWVNHIVTGIKETAAVINPDSIKPNKADKVTPLSESLDKDGKPCLYLPRLNPYDAYFLHNPDGYYQVK